MNDRIQVWISRDVFRTLIRILEAESGAIEKSTVEFYEERGPFMSLLESLEEARNNNWPEDRNEGR